MYLLIKTAKTWHLINQLSIFVCASPFSIHGCIVLYDHRSTIFFLPLSRYLILNLSYRLPHFFHFFHLSDIFYFFYFFLQSLPGGHLPHITDPKGFSKMAVDFLLHIGLPADVANLQKNTLLYGDMWTYINCNRKEEIE